MNDDTQLCNRDHYSHAPLLMVAHIGSLLALFISLLMLADTLCHSGEIAHYDLSPWVGDLGRVLVSAAVLILSAAVRVAHARG